MKNKIFVNCTTLGSLTHSAIYYLQSADTKTLKLSAKSLPTYGTEWSFRYGEKLNHEEQLYEEVENWRGIELCWSFQNSIWSNQAANLDEIWLLKRRVQKKGQSLLPSRAKGVDGNSNGDVMWRCAILNRAATQFFDFHTRGATGPQGFLKITTTNTTQGLVWRDPKWFLIFVGV